MNLSKDNKYALIILLACIAIPVTISIYQSKALREHRDSTHGIVTDVFTKIREAGIGFQYDFICTNGTKVTSTTYFDCNNSIKISEIRKLIVNRQFPVVFDTEDCGINFMIFDKSGIDRYHIAGKLTEEDKANIALMARICNH